MDNFLIDIISLILSLFALAVSTTVLYLKALERKTKIDDNIINYLRGVLDIFERLPQMKNDDKKLIKSMIEEFEYFSDDDFGLKNRIIQM